MEIKLTKKQYENLIKLVYLGNWMINAIHSGQPGDERIERYEELEQYIFSFAKETGLENYIEFDGEFNQFFPTREFEEDTDVEQHHEDYDEDVFWEELFYRMSGRDFERAYSIEEISKMKMKERFEKEEPFREKWDKELNEHGIERLEIREE
jgi:hypothetical protein